MVLEGLMMVCLLVYYATIKQPSPHLAGALRDNFTSITFNAHITIKESLYSFPTIAEYALHTRREVVWCPSSTFATECTIGAFSRRPIFLSKY